MNLIKLIVDNNLKILKNSAYMVSIQFQWLGWLLIIFYQQLAAADNVDLLRPLSDENIAMLLLIITNITTINVLHKKKTW